jgi:hypothetical protein
MELWYACPKAYPAYFGAYGEFDKVRAYLDQFANLYPIGRNGMHRYNNQDHSMLAANGAVSAIIKGGGKTQRSGASMPKMRTTSRSTNPPECGTSVATRELCFANRGLESIAIMIVRSGLVPCRPKSQAPWN